jgi:asparagine synthase (glutamine-hydrolysing)
MCMRHSLEARVPFLDSAIVDASFRMNWKYKIDGTNKKKILKETFADLLPKEVFEFKKKGFGVPLTLWFRNELKSELLEVLNAEAIKKQGIFNADFIQSLISEHMSGKENHASQLWVLYVFQKWYIKNFEA